MHTAHLIWGANDLPAGFSGLGAGRKVLLMLSRRGTNTHEALVPLFRLEAAGAEVVIGSDRSGDVQLDPLCNALATVESPWSPVFHMLRRTHRRRLRAMEVSDASAERFDAVIVPGGHGRAFGAFATGDRLRAIIHAFAAHRRIIGVQCHAVVAAALAGPEGQAPIAAGREVTCWPRSLERVLTLPPIAGRYLRPLGPFVEDLVAPVAARLHTHVLPWRMPHVVIDDRLVTSWGPWSAELFTQAVMRQMEACHAH